MSECRALEAFLSAYFHQDWQVEHGQAEHVVAYFIDNESDAELVRVRDDLAALSALGLDEVQLAARFRAMGCEYDPTRDGISWQQWLGSLQVRFAR